MKKNWYFLLVIFMFFSFCTFVCAKEDVTAPKLNGITNSKNRVKANDQLYISVSITEEDSGINHGTVGLYSYSKNEINYQLELKDINGTPYIIIPNNIENDKYMIGYVYLTDKALNSEIYYNNRLKDLLELKGDDIKYIQYQTTDLTVSDNKEEELVKPFIKDISLSKNIVNINEENVLSIIPKNESKISNMYVCFTRLSGPGDINLILNYNGSTNVFENSFKAKKSGDYSLTSIQVIDENNNYFTFKTNSRDNDQNAILLEKEYKFKVSGDDIEKGPTLNEYDINKTKVKKGEKVKFTLNAEDEDGVDKIEASFISKTKSQLDVLVFGEIELKMNYNPETNKYEGYIEINEDIENDTYYLQYVVLQDKRGNYSNYSTNVIPKGKILGNGGSTIKINGISFDVVDPTEYDLEISTIEDDYVEKIKELKDDGVIFIDSNNNPTITKELFDVIKDTDKKVIIRYSEYEWIFEGKDIFDPKQIDVSIATELLQNNKINNDKGDHVSILFKNNGKLPGKAIIRIRVEKTFKYEDGYKDLLIYYGDDNNLSLIKKNIDDSDIEYDRVNLSEDGYYEFEITHNSSYILTNKELEFTNNINFKDVINLDNNYIWIFLGLVFVICLFVAFSSSKDKKVDNEIVSKDNHNILDEKENEEISTNLIDKKEDYKDQEEIKEKNIEESTIDNSNKEESDDLIDKKETDEHNQLNNNK